MLWWDGVVCRRGGVWWSRVAGREVWVRVLGLSRVVCVTVAEVLPMRWSRWWTTMIQVLLYHSDHPHPPLTTRYTASSWVIPPIIHAKPILAPKRLPPRVILPRRVSMTSLLIMRATVILLHPRILIPRIPSAHVPLFVFLEPRQLG